MEIKIVYSLVLLLFLAVILFVVYHNFIYQILQHFKRKNEHGYILLETSEYEHRAKVEKLVGRKLLPNEEVYHINGKKWNNRPSNLALMTTENHQKWHLKLSAMYENGKFPSIKAQRKKLIEEFSARLF